MATLQFVPALATGLHLISLFARVGAKTLALVASNETFAFEGGQALAAIMGDRGGKQRADGAVAKDDRVASASVQDVVDRVAVLLNELADSDLHAALPIQHELQNMFAELARVTFSPPASSSPQTNDSKAPTGTVRAAGGASSAAEAATAVPLPALPDSSSSSSPSSRSSPSRLQSSSAPAVAAARGAVAGARAGARASSRAEAKATSSVTGTRPSSAGGGSKRPNLSPIEEAIGRLIPKLADSYDAIAQHLEQSTVKNTADNGGRWDGRLHTAGLVRVKFNATNGVIFMAPARAWIATTYYKEHFSSSTARAPEE